MREDSAAGEAGCEARDVFEDEESRHSGGNQAKDRDVEVASVPEFWSATKALFRASLCAVARAGEPDKQTVKLGKFARVNETKIAHDDFGVRVLAGILVGEEGRNFDAGDDAESWILEGVRGGASAAKNIHHPIDAAACEPVTNAECPDARRDEHVPIGSGDLKFTEPGDVFEVAPRVEVNDRPDVSGDSPLYDLDAGGMFVANR